MKFIKDIMKREQEFVQRFGRQPNVIIVGKIVYRDLLTEVYLHGLDSLKSLFGADIELDEEIAVDAVRLIRR